MRCKSSVARHTPASLHWAAAFTLSALFLYVPANLFPILRVELYGGFTENTVWDGTARLFRDGDFAVGVVVLLASVVAPVVKIIALFLLLVSTALRWPRARFARTWLWRFVELIGRWAMIDVFAVAILVAAVKINGVATVIPGRGLLSYTGLVVFTTLASASFDPWLIWQSRTRAGDSSQREDGKTIDERSST